MFLLKKFSYNINKCFGINKIQIFFFYEKTDFVYGKQKINLSKDYRNIIISFNKFYILV